MKSESADQVEGGAGVSDPFAVDLFAASRRDASQEESSASTQDAQSVARERPWHVSLPRLSRDEVRLSKVLSALPSALSEEALAALAHVLARFGGVEEREVELDVIDLREAVVAGFIARSDSEQSPRLFVNLRVEPDGAPFALALDSAFACSVVDRVLGGDGSPPDALRGLSPTERAVVEFLCLRALHELNALTGEPLLMLESVSEKAASLSSFGAGKGEGESQAGRQDSQASRVEPRVLVTTARVVIGATAGLVRVAMPEAALASLNAAESPLLLNSQKRRDALAKRLTAWHRLAADVPLRVGVGETRVSVGDIAGLERGDVVIVEQTRVSWRGGRYAGRVSVFAGAGAGVRITGRIAAPDESENTVEGTPALVMVVEGLSRGTGRKGTERFDMENEERSDGEASAAALEGLLLTLHVELPARRISLEELSRLRAGQVLELGCRPTDPVELVADGRRVAAGELVEVEGQLGVRVTRLIG